MSISTEITKLNTNLTASYTACQNKGATMPTDQNFDNLATCIGSIQTGGSPTLQTKSVSLTNKNGQTFSADNGYDGLSQITVTPNNQARTVTPTKQQQSLTVNSGYSGNGTITVNAVNSSIDSNITAGNIKNGVSILGVTGNYTGTTPTGTLSITANGTYDVTNYASANVSVSGGGGSIPILIITCVNDADVLRLEVDINTMTVTDNYNGDVEVQNLLILCSEWDDDFISIMTALSEIFTDTFIIWGDLINGTASSPGVALNGTLLEIIVVE